MGRTLTSVEKGKVNAILDYIDELESVDTSTAPDIEWPAPGRSGQLTSGTMAASTTFTTPDVLHAYRVTSLLTVLQHSQI